MGSNKKRTEGLAKELAGVLEKYRGKPGAEEAAMLALDCHPRSGW